MYMFYISVALANLLFPMQAKVAMEIAQVDGTSEFTLETAYSQNLANAQRTTVDLNDAPFLIKEEHLVRLRALSKTGKCNPTNLKFALISECIFLSLLCTNQSFAQN